MAGGEIALFPVLSSICDFNDLFSIFAKAFVVQKVHDLSLWGFAESEISDIGSVSYLPQETK